MIDVEAHHDEHWRTAKEMMTGEGIPGRFIARSCEDQLHTWERSSVSA